MEDYCVQNNLKRTTKTHREICVFDARKTQPDKLKTVLRFKVERTKGVRIELPRRISDPSPNVLNMELKVKNCGSRSPKWYFVMGLRRIGFT